MARWDVEINETYTCDDTEAAAKVHTLLEDVKKEFSAHVRSIAWNGDTAVSINGKGFEGRMDVGGGKVTGGLKLGLAMKLLKGKIGSELSKRIRAALG